MGRSVATAEASEVRYRTLVVDPPWRVHQGPSHGKLGGGSGNPNRSVPYATMTVKEIEALPVPRLADFNAHLYVWTINRYIEATYQLVHGWGFRPSTLLTWCKPVKGLGMGGAYSLTTEFVLFARRGIGAFERRWNSSWFDWPRSEHSAKPEAFLDVVEQVSPAPRAELFARRARFGWSYPLGNEALGGVAV